MRWLTTGIQYGLVWGRSSRFAPQPQKVGLAHQVTADDVVSVFTK